MTVSGPVRLGIVGCGAITEIAHLPAVLASPLVTLTALSDTNEERMQYLIRRYNLTAKACVDYRQAFPLVDAVVIALPNHLHASIGMSILNQGVHVLCEKPLAATVAECRQLCASAREHAAVLAVGYVTRFHPSTELTKQLLDENYLGRLSSFDYEFGTEGGWAPLSGYNLQRETSGGGVLLVSGSHFIDRMLHFFPGVQVESCVHDGRGGVEANCSVWLRALVGSGEISGCITLSKTRKLNNRLRIVGDNGSLEIGETQGETVTFQPAGSALQHEIGYRSSGDDGPPDAFRMQLEDFVAAIRDGQKPRIDGAAGSRSIELIERCYEIAEPMAEPWTDFTLDRLKSALPLGTA